MNLPGCRLVEECRLSPRLSNDATDVLVAMVLADRERTAVAGTARVLAVLPRVVHILGVVSQPSEDLGHWKAQLVESFIA